MRNGPPHRLRFRGHIRRFLTTAPTGRTITEKSIGGANTSSHPAQRGEGQVVGTRCSSCCDYAIGVDTIAGCDGPLEINGDNSYGYPPLKRAIATRYGVDPDCVITAAGTSGANYLAFSTLLEPGDEVLIEDPTYGLLVDALESVGAVVKRFARTHDGGYALETEAVRRAITPKTKLHLRLRQSAQSVERPDRRKRLARDRARLRAEWVREYWSTRSTSMRSTKIPREPPFSWVRTSW